MRCEVILRAVARVGREGAATPGATLIGAQKQGIAHEVANHLNYGNTVAIQLSDMSGN